MKNCLKMALLLLASASMLPVYANESEYEQDGSAEEMPADEYVEDNAGGEEYAEPAEEYSEGEGSDAEYQPEEANQE